MLKVLLLSFMLTSHVFGEEEDERKIRVKQQSFMFVNGTCHYLNRTVPGGSMITLKDPCELWECDGNKKNLIVTGCSLPDKYGSCVYYSTGRSNWPYCCRYSRVC